MSDEISRAVKAILEDSPNLEFIDGLVPSAFAPLEVGPGDFPIPTVDGSLIAMNEAGPFASPTVEADTSNPEGYQEGPGWDGGVVGDPNVGPGEAGDGYAGGGPSDPSPGTGDFEGSGEGTYGPGGFADGGYGEGGAFGGGQAGAGESGGQFGGGEGGYEGEDGYGGYGGYGEDGDGGE
jgi:hypothetical protein